jgi:hypothetical protein
MIDPPEGAMLKSAIAAIVVGLLLYGGVATLRRQSGTPKVSSSTQAILMVVLFGILTAIFLPIVMYYGGYQ